MCVAWSTEGSQEQTAHASDRPHSAWSCERQAFAARGDEHIFFAECTPRYQVQRLLVDKMLDHEIFNLVTGPEVMGWPVRRQRMLMAGINRKRMKYVGPSNYVEDFTRRFNKAMQLTGDVFFQAPAELRAQEYSELARGRKFQVTPEDALEFGACGMSRLFEFMLPPGAMLRLQQYQALRAEHPAEVFIADVDHNANSKGSSAGTVWPVQLTHGTVVVIAANIEDSRVAVGLEHFAAMGFNIFPPQGCALPRSPLYGVLQDLTHRQKKYLAGNGMHLATQAAWMLYILSNCVRVNDEKLRRGLGSWEAPDDDDDDDDDGAF